MLGKIHFSKRYLEKKKKEKRKNGKKGKIQIYWFH